MTIRLTRGERAALEDALNEPLAGYANASFLVPAVEKIIAGRLAARDERIDQAVSRAERDPYDKPVYVQGHSHSEPVCAWPDCATYLTRKQMAERAALDGGA